MQYSGPVFIKHNYVGKEKYKQNPTLKQTRKSQKKVKQN